MRTAIVLCAFAAAACARQATQSEETMGAQGMTLVATSWRLVSFQSSDDARGTVRPDNPGKYSLTFERDGRVAMRLNCNSARGRWVAVSSGVGSGSLRITRLATTRAACPPPSLDQQIAQDASYMRSYILRNGLLHISLEADGGIYTWEPGPP